MLIPEYIRQMKHRAAALYVYISVKMSSLHLNANVHLLFEPPTFRPLSVCLTGKCVERLPVRMLLLSAILAPDLQGAEEKSSIPRLLLLLLHLGQIHCPDLPAGGALGLDAPQRAFSPGLRSRLPSRGQELI